MSVRLAKSVFPTLILIGAVLLLMEGGQKAAVNEQELWRHRNLGRAFYENPTTTAQAVDEFKAALDLAPDSFRERLNYGLALVKSGSFKEGVAELEKAQRQNPQLPHTWFNLGVAYKKMGDYPKAIVQFEQMAKLVPDEPVTRFNLGLLYNMTGREKEALHEFETAHRLDPKLVAPLFQVYNLHRLGGREKEATQALAVFLKAKEQQKHWDESEDMEWSYYAEIYDPLEPDPAAANAKPAPLRFEERTLGAADGVAVLDFDQDGHPDLIAWSEAGVQAYRSGAQAVDVGLTELKGTTGIASADYDNDGFPDLCILTGARATLYKNGKGKFQPVAIPSPSSPRKAVWLDYDHDGDPDLFLFGEKPMLLVNQVEKGFADHSAEFPFAAGKAVDAVPFRLLADGKGFDLVVSYAGQTGVLYRDQMRAQYRAEPLPALPVDATALTAFDVNGDGWLDLACDQTVLLNRESKLEPASLGAGKTAVLVFADLENRGASDLAAGNVLYRNLKRAGTISQLAQVMAAADFDQDGRTDLAGTGADGRLRVLLNRSASSNHWIGVDLEGIKNAKLSAGSEVEIKAGAHYQKRPYDGTPLLFGLGAAPQADTVRITWPNGMIQNVPDQRAGQVVRVKEAPRLSGSCPMVFVWNGRGFEFLSDVLGVAPLGANSGNGRYFPVDHDEYLWIPGDMLRLRNGRYEIRVTEELKEVTYLDQVRLIAVDHPARVDVYTNDKFKSPPFPEFRLFGVAAPDLSAPRQRRTRPRRAAAGPGPRPHLPGCLPARFQRRGRDAPYRPGLRRRRCTR